MFFFSVFRLRYQECQCVSTYYGFSVFSCFFRFYCWCATCEVKLAYANSDDTSNHTRKNRRIFVHGIDWLNWRKNKFSINHHELPRQYIDDGSAMCFIILIAHWAMLLCTYINYTFNWCHHLIYCAIKQDSQIPRKRAHTINGSGNFSLVFLFFSLVCRQIWFDLRRDQIVVH